MGKHACPGATELLVTADDGPKGGWYWLLGAELRRLADEIGLAISVCHFPPGTSQWTEIEHRMSCQITEDRRSRPLVGREVIVDLIGPRRAKRAVRPKPDPNGDPPD